MAGYKFSTWKFLFCAFVLFCIYNHVLRAVAQDSGVRVGGESVGGFAVPSGNQFIFSLNDIRRDCGRGVRSFSRKCPESVVKYCEHGAYGINVLLGLN